MTPEGEIKIHTKPHEHDVEVEVEVPKPPAPGKPPPPMIVNVLATAPGFEIKGKRFAKIVVPLDKDSKPVFFKLKAKELGQKKITLDFIQDGRYLGVVNLEVYVIETYKKIKEAKAKLEGQVEIGAISDAPDLTLLIQEIPLPNSKTELRYTLTSPQTKLNLFYADFGSKIFSSSIKDYVDSMLKRIEEFSQREDIPSKVIQDRLTAIGNNLYDQVFPDSFKDFYWKNKDKIKSIVVVSDEPWIPWEVVKPYRVNKKVKQDDFLCQSFSFSRWLRGSCPPTEISFTPGKILGVGLEEDTRDISIVPKKRFDAKGACQELQFIRKISKQIEDIPPKLEAIYNLLEIGQFKLFHVCCHGTYNSQSPDHSFVQLVDGTFSPEDIIGSKTNFGKEKPFIFFNACHTARAGYSLTRIGSWASRFIEAGCSGFVGSFWSVDDELASEFAKSLYSCLVERGIPLGEAFRQARIETQRKNPNNPSWLAYCLYGDPLAKARLHKSS